jgi:hypothetical protein
MGLGCSNMLFIHSTFNFNHTFFFKVSLPSNSASLTLGNTCCAELPILARNLFSSPRPSQIFWLLPLFLSLITLLGYYLFFFSEEHWDRSLTIFASSPFKPPSLLLLLYTYFFLAILFNVICSRRTDKSKGFIVQSFTIDFGCKQTNRLQWHCC